MSWPRRASSRRVDHAAPHGVHRISPSVVLPAVAVALAAGTMVALGTDHHAWMAAPLLGAWGVALPACTAFLVLGAAACVASVPLTRGILVLVLAACVSLGLVLGTHDARSWHRCMQSLGVTHPDARTLVALTGTVVTAPEPSRLADPVMEPLASDRRAVRFALGSICSGDGVRGRDMPRSTCASRVPTPTWRSATASRSRVGFRPCGRRPIRVATTCRAGPDHASCWVRSSSSPTTWSRV